MTVGEVIKILKDRYGGFVYCKEYGVDIDTHLVCDMFFEIKMRAVITQNEITME